MNRVDVARGVNHDTALPIVGRDLQKPLAQPLVKAGIEPLEPVGLAGAPRRANKPLRCRQVEDQGQVRREIAEREPVQCAEIGERQSAAVALIGQGRIGKPVAYDPLAAVERRPDQPRYMVASRRVEQQNLGNGVPTLVGASEQQIPDRLGTG